MLTNKERLHILDNIQIKPIERKINGMILLRLHYQRKVKLDECPICFDACEDCCWNIMLNIHCVSSSAWIASPYGVGGNRERRPLLWSIVRIFQLNQWIKFYKKYYKKRFHKKFVQCIDFDEWN